jgi:UDP-2-acetamido-2-deoxy-ribo-hexuluronate aminotransferase
MRWNHVHGQEKKHFHPIIGISGRLNLLQAAIVLEKLKIFEDEMRLREEVASRYDGLLRDLPLTLPSLSEGNTSVYAQ